MGTPLFVPDLFIDNSGTLIRLTCVLEKDILSVNIARYNRTSYTICGAQYKITMQIPLLKLLGISKQWQLSIKPSAGAILSTESLGACTDHKCSWVQARNWLWLISAAITKFLRRLHTGSKLPRKNHHAKSQPWTSLLKMSLPLPRSTSGYSLCCCHHRPENLFLLQPLSTLKRKSL